MEDRVRKSIKELRAHKDKIDKVAKSVFDPAPVTFFMLDFFFIAAMNRAVCLLRGFCDLLESENFIAAAPLARLQLDNCLRLAAVGWVENPHEFASQVLSGIPIRKLRDSTGTYMTDAHLRDRLAQDFPWIKPIYKHTSGFIHLSEKHIFNALRIESEKDHTIVMKISDRDEFVPPEAYFEAIEVFRKLTNLFLDFMRAWGDMRRSLEKNEARQKVPNEGTE